MQRWLRGVSGFVVGLLVLSGCGGAYDREAFIDELATQDGIGRAEATCITDGLEQRVGVDRLTSPGELSEDEERVAIEVAFECLLGPSR